MFTGYTYFWCLASFLPLGAEHPRICPFMHGKIDYGHNRQLKSLEVKNSALSSLNTNRFSVMLQDSDGDDK